MCDLYTKEDYLALGALHAAVLSFFNDVNGAVYDIPEILIGVFRWVPNNVIWLNSQSQGSHHYDIITFGLLYTVHQVLASIVKHDWHLTEDPFFEPGEAPHSVLDFTCY